MEMFGQSNSIILADNLNYLSGCKQVGKNNFIDLIYIDPPFNSNRTYNIPFKNDSQTSEEAFNDIWSVYAYYDELEYLKNENFNLYSFLYSLEKSNILKSYICYLTMMSIRCSLMRETLKDSGTFFYHCDPTMSHYIKIILDYIFGSNNFRNEIIWSYKTGGIGNRAFASKHDVILFYSKTNRYTYNPQRERKETNSINQAIYKGNEIFEDDKGKYTYHFRPGTNPKYPDGTKEYLDYANMRDVWTDIPTINAMASERLYPTQKPRKLLERIILTGSNTGDLIADFFMGGGTTIIESVKSSRKFIGTDLNTRALQITIERLLQEKKVLKKDFYVYGIPKSSKELRDLVEKNLIGKSVSTFELEEITIRYYLNGVTGNDKKVHDGSIDGRFTFKFNNEYKKGIVQVTKGSNLNHFKAFCSEVGNGKNDIGVYITFANQVTKDMNMIAYGPNGYGKIGDVYKIQILTFEDLIDNQKQYEVPSNIKLFV